MINCSSQLCKKRFSRIEGKDFCGMESAKTLFIQKPMLINVPPDLYSSMKRQENIRDWYNFIAQKNFIYFTHSYEINNAKEIEDYLQSDKYNQNIEKFSALYKHISQGASIILSFAATQLFGPTIGLVYSLGNTTFSFCLRHLEKEFGTDIAIEIFISSLFKKSASYLTVAASNNKQQAESLAKQQCLKFGLNLNCNPMQLSIGSDEFIDVCSVLVDYVSQTPTKRQGFLWLSKVPKYNHSDIPRVETFYILSKLRANLNAPLILKPFEEILRSIIKINSVNYFSY